MVVGLSSVPNAEPSTSVKTPRPGDFGRARVRTEVDFSGYPVNASGLQTHHKNVLQHLTDVLCC